MQRICGGLRKSVECMKHTQSQMISDELKAGDVSSAGVGLVSLALIWDACTPCQIPSEPKTPTLRSSFFLSLFLDSSMLKLSQ